MSAGGSEPVAEHERLMAQALELAEKGAAQGRSRTLSPLVGCVIVKDDEVIGRGWSEGGPHAEVNALKDAENAQEEVAGATVYVTQGPCNQANSKEYDSSCTDALISAGVRRVVVAAKDPNPNARGIETLQEAGIEVVTGVLQGEAERQNEVYRTVQRNQRPFVLYKTAMTLDGKIATRTGQSRWITGKAARDLVQVWRDELDAVAVGINTVLLDDPLLTSRLEEGHTPIKVIFDSVARTPVDAKLFDPDPQGQDARVVLFVTEKAPKARVAALQEEGAAVFTLNEVRGRTDVGAALKKLYELGVVSLLLEGGGTLAWSFFEQRAVDKIATFIGPKLLGGGGASPLGGLGVTEMDEAIELGDITTDFVEQDLLITGRVHYPEKASEQEGQAEQEVS